MLGVFSRLELYSGRQSASVVLDMLGVLKPTKSDKAWCALASQHLPDLQYAC